MSLLNGIRFITRENRQNQSADGENGSKSHSKSKSHLKEYSKSTRNKHKSDHKHRDKKHLKSKSSHKSEKKNSNSILKKNKYDSSSGSDSGDVSSEEEVNMKEIAREEMEKERKHQMELLLQRNSLLNPPVVDIDAMPMSHIVHTKDVAGRDQTQTQVQKVNSNEKDQSTPPTVTNASVASLLRSKLKAGTQLKGSVATHLSDHSMLNTVYDTKMKKIEEALQEKDADVDDKSKNKMILNSTGYMSQDAQFNIGQMLKQEKYSSTGVNDAFIHNVMKMGTKYKDTGLKSNDSTREGDGEGIGDSDDDMERLSKKRKKSLLDFDNNSDSDENGGLDKHRHSHHNGISNHTNGYDSGDGDDIDMSLYVKKASISRTDRQTQEEKNWSIRKEASKIAHKSEYEQSISAKCRFCQLSNENSSSFLNHSHKLNVSQSPNVILKLKSKKDSLSKGHCEIIPRHHVCSYTLCDEDTRTEIDHYKESLIKYFEMQFNQGVVFIETAINLTSDRTHMVIDAIPQPKININDIPMYFKQALRDCDEEWGVHKVISLTRQIKNNKDMSNIIHHMPLRSNKFPYISIQWTRTVNKTNIQKQKSDEMECAGYLYMVDDSTKFTFLFGLEVIKNMLLCIAEDEACSDDEMHDMNHEHAMYDEEFYNSNSKWKIYDWMEYI